MATSTRQFVTHTQMFMHAMARRGSRHTVRVCALKVDSGSRSLVAAAESAYRSCRHTVRVCALKAGFRSKILAAPAESDLYQLRARPRAPFCRMSTSCGDYLGWVGIT